MEDLADTRLAPKISQLSGVGLVTISGGQKPAVRIRANPATLASYGMNMEDLRTAIAATNVNQAKGSFDGPYQNFQIGANDQLLSSAGYRSLVVAYRNGAPLKLTEVADVVDGVEDVHQAAWANSTPAVIVNVQRQPGANIIDVVDRIKTLLPSLTGTLPAAIHVAVLTDRTNTIRASVKDVEFELMLTITLVVMVIFLFLRTLAATVIPSVAVPLSIVGTFAAMYMLGYSLNNLTLMALTISTGFVVDDAIVMIENIARYIEHGEKPLEAALKGAEQIAFTIISLTISLIAVLIPLLFMGDIVGRLFREFAVTLAVTILVSAVVSLTLTPMMAARLLKHTPPEQQGRFYKWSDQAFERIIKAYGRTLDVVLEHQTATLMVFVGTLVLTFVLLWIVPKGFFPIQDTGVIQGVAVGPQTVSFPEMTALQQRAAAIILKDPAVASLSSFVGHRSDEHDAQQRTPADQSQAARGSRRRRHGDHHAPAAAAPTDPGMHGVHAARAGHQRRRPREPDAVSVHARGSERRRAARRGRPGCSTGCRSCPSCATWPATSRRSASGRSWSSIAKRRHGWASRRR